MPYHIKDGFVIGPTGKKMNKKRHKSKKAALAHMRALYANSDAAEKIAKVDNGRRFSGNS